MLNFQQGWTDIDAQRLAAANDPEYLKERTTAYTLISRQESEFLKSFSFWPSPVARSGSHLYDVRSYSIRPGSLSGLFLGLKLLQKL